MATKRKDGRLQSSVTITDFFTGTKKKIYVYGYTEKELEAEKTRVKKEAEHLLLSATEPSFEEWYVSCLNTKLLNKDINEVTHESYEIKIKRHVLPNLPVNIKVSEIKPYHIKHIIESINGSRTRNYVYTILNSLLKEAVFERLAMTNPCSLVRKPKHKSKHARVLTPEQYQAIIAEVKDSQWEYLLKFAINTGCRRSEISGLKWSEVDFKNQTANIKVAMKETKRRGVHEGTTKSEYSIRKLLLSNEATQALRDWKKTLLDRLAKSHIHFSEDSPVFRNNIWIDRPISPSAITRKIGDLRNQLDLPERICTHSFRHTYATSLAEQDVQIKKIQLTIGHASAAFTADTYLHSTPDMLNGIQEANETISKKFKTTK